MSFEGPHEAITSKPRHFLTLWITSLSALSRSALALSRLTVVARHGSLLADIKGQRLRAVLAPLGSQDGSDGSGSRNMRCRSERQAGFRGSWVANGTANGTANGRQVPRCFRSVQCPYPQA